MTSAKIFPKYIIFCCLVYFSFFLRPSGSGHMDVYGIFFSDGRIVIIVLEEVYTFSPAFAVCVCVCSPSSKSRQKAAGNQIKRMKKKQRDASRF